MKRTDTGETLKKYEPAAFEKLAKAMYLSKGKADTDLGRTLCKVPTATPEDIARLAPYNDQHPYGNIWNKEEMRGDELKRKQFGDKFKVSLLDTFIVRYMKKLGVDIDTALSKEDRKVIEQHLVPVTENKPFYKTFGGYQFSTIINKFKSIVSTPEEIRKDVFGDGELAEIWATGRGDPAHFPYWRATPAGMSEEQKKKQEDEFYKNQLVKRAKELVMYKFAPESIKAELRQYRADRKREEEEQKAKGNWYNRQYEFTTLSQVWYENSRLEPWKIEKELELQDFYQALEYMGLGIVCVGQAKPYNQKNIRHFVTHTIATVKRFQSDIKKGFDVANVQALVSEDLNIWLKDRVEDKWKTFVRTDAPTAYPDIEVKGKKKVKATKEPHDEATQALINVVKQALGE